MALSGLAISREKRSSSLMNLYGYAICTTPRSGSNFLCQLLTSTGRLGRPLEWFNGPARRTLDHPGYPDDPEAQLAAILDLGCTENGVYGVKLFPHQFAQVEHTAWTERLPNLRYVHLRRNDLLGAALSWARALQTGQYRSTSPRAGEASYDAALIGRCLDDLVQEEAQWRLWFARSGIHPLGLEHERVVADPHEAVRAVAGLVGLEGDIAPDLSRIDLEVQADAETAVWRGRFLTENRQAASIAEVRRRFA